MEKFLETYLFTSVGRRKVVRVLERLVYVVASFIIAVLVIGLLLR